MKIDIIQKWGREADAGKLLATVQLIFDGKMTLGGTELPENTVEFLVRFGLRQVVQNTYAGVGPFEDAKKAVLDKIAALKSGELTVREGGDPLLSHRRAVVQAALDSDKRKEDKAKFAKVDAKARTKWLDAYLAAGDDTFKANVERLATARYDAVRAAKLSAADI
jgi:hypothetical protein